MTEETNVIIDGSEDEYLGNEEQEHFESTHTPVNQGMEFHVQMKGYTLADFDDRVIDSAARVVLGHRGHEKLAREIQAKCIELTQEQISKALKPVAADIIDQPMLPKHSFPSIKEKDTPITMREFVGLCGREFLQQRVDRAGNPSTETGMHSSKTRYIDYVVKKHLDDKFRREIEAETNKVIYELRDLLRDAQNAFLASEKQRLKKSFSKILD